MTGHEHEDIDIRRIFRIAGLSVVVMILVHLAVWGMFVYYRAEEQSRDVRQTLIDTPVQPPPEPRLQVNPSQDWQAYYRSQQLILNSYGWTSREQGRVHIPIERAMELFAQREGSR